MNNKQQQLIQILGQMDQEQRHRFVDRFNSLGPEQATIRQAPSPARQNCYNCGNRVATYISGFRSIRFHRCSVYSVVGSGGSEFCTLIMSYNEQCRTRCPEWRPRRSMWQRFRAWWAE